MALDDILTQVPIDDIAAKLGVSPDVAKKAVEQGGAVLLGGLAKNASSEEGSAAIRKALKKHEGKTSVSTVDDVDQADGDKIVTHVLGEQKQQVTQKLNASEKTAGIDFGTLLPMLAPIIMGLIANKNKEKSTTTDGAESGGGIGDLLGGILGGGSSSGGSGGGIDLGGIIGNIFGGKK